MVEPHDFDVLSPEFHANPLPTFDRMRAEGAVVRMKLPILGRTSFAVTHDACAALLKDHESFARDPANAGSRTQARILTFLPRTIGPTTIPSTAGCAVWSTRRSSVDPSRP